MNVINLEEVRNKKAHEFLEDLQGHIENKSTIICVITDSDESISTCWIEFVADKTTNGCTLIGMLEMGKRHVMDSMDSMDSMDEEEE